MRRLSPFAFGLLVLTLLALGVRLIHVIVVERGDEPTGDAVYYHEAANLFAEGQGFIEPYRYLYGGEQERLFVDDPSIVEVTANTRLPVGHEEPTAGHPPLWVLVLAVFSFIGLKSFLAHQVISAVIGAAAVPLVGLLGREVAGTRTGLVAAFFTAVYGFLWLADGMVMSETLVVILVVATSLAALRFQGSLSSRDAMLVGLLGGLGALTRAEIALYLPLVVLWIVIRAGGMIDWRRRFELVGAAGGVALLVVAPWVIRNLAVFEEPVFLSNGSGIVLAQANCDATYYGDKQGYWEYLCGLPQPLGDDGQPIDESQRDVVYRERGLDYIGNHTGRLVTHVVPVRILRIWGLYDPVQQLRADVLVEGRTFALSVASLVQFYALAVLAVVGALVLRRRGNPLAPLLLWPIVITFVAATAFATTRYRAPAEVTIVVLAAVAVDAGLRRGSPVPGGGRSDQ